eukprot:16448350-Heterocapsa_arctica.AAC.1
MRQPRLHFLHRVEGVHEVVHRPLHAEQPYGHRQSGTVEWTDSIMRLQGDQVAHVQVLPRPRTRSLRLSHWNSCHWGTAA